MRTHFINHTSLRVKLCALARARAGTISIIHAPEKFGKSTLSEALCDEFEKDGLTTVHLRLQNLQTPKDIMDEILRCYETIRDLCARFNGVRVDQSSNTASISNVTVSGSQSVAINASVARDERVLNIYYTELFEALCKDLETLNHSLDLVIIVDGFERGDLITQRWVGACLPRLAASHPARLFLFSRERETIPINYQFQKMINYFTIEEIKDREEVFSFYRENGVTIDQTIIRLVDNTISSYRGQPSIFSLIVRAALL